MTNNEILAILAIKGMQHNQNKLKNKNLRKLEKAEHDLRKYSIGAEPPQSRPFSWEVNAREKHMESVRKQDTDREIRGISTAKRTNYELAENEIDRIVYKHGASIAYELNEDSIKQRKRDTKSDDHVIVNSMLVQNICNGEENCPGLIDSDDEYDSDSDYDVSTTSDTIIFESLNTYVSHDHGEELIAELYNEDDENVNENSDSESQHSSESETSNSSPNNLQISEFVQFTQHPGVNHTLNHQITETTEYPNIDHDEYVSNTFFTEYEWDEIVANQWKFKIKLKRFYFYRSIGDENVLMELSHENYMRHNDIYFHLKSCRTRERVTQRYVDVDAFWLDNDVLDIANYNSLYRESPSATTDKLQHYYSNTTYQVNKSTLSFDGTTMYLRDHGHIVSRYFVGDKCHHTGLSLDVCRCRFCVLLHTAIEPYAESYEH